MNRENGKPSIMERKFELSNGASYDCPPLVPDWQPRYYFVYGTLMDPEQARLVLHLKDRPKMHRATLEGWALKMWGEYPALVDEKGPNIHGQAFKVMTKHQENLLKHYETAHYTTQPCWIDIEHKGERMAWTFRWAGRDDELRNGSFDLKDWQLKRLDYH